MNDRYHDNKNIYKKLKGGNLNHKIMRRNLKGGNLQFWETRPAYMQTVIDDEFNDYVIKSESRWKYNGLSDKDKYYLCNIDDYELIMKIIKCSTQTNLYFMDLGAGKDYGWVFNLSHYLSTQDLQGKHIHIYGTNVEPELVDITPFPTAQKIKYVAPVLNYESSYYAIPKGNITVYLLDKFNVQNFAKDPRISHIQFDLVVSNYCLRHLYDPIGTILQIINALKVGGYFLFDSFRIEIITEKYFNIQYVPLFISVLFNLINVEYLIDAKESGRGRGFYIIQKTAATNMNADNISTLITYQKEDGIGKHDTGDHTRWIKFNYHGYPIIRNDTIEEYITQNFLRLFGTNKVFFCHLFPKRHISFYIDLYKKELHDGVIKEGNYQTNMELLNSIVVNDYIPYFDELSKEQQQNYDIRSIIYNIGTGGDNYFYFHKINIEYNVPLIHKTSEQ